MQQASGLYEHICRPEVSLGCMDTHAYIRADLRCQCTAGQGSPPGGIPDDDFPVSLHMLFNHLLGVNEAAYTFSASLLYVSPLISLSGGRDYS